jgi:hypothetical protein
MSGTLWDAPNQQVVRPDQSPPWQEGTGDGADVDGEPGPSEQPTLDEMTKAQLLVYADEHDIEVDPAASKADIRAAIDEAE